MRGTTSHDERASSIRKVVRDLHALMNRDERRRATLLLIFGVAITALDVLALLTIIPLVTILGTGSLPAMLAGGADVVPIPEWVSQNAVLVLGAAVVLLFIIRGALGMISIAWALSLSARVELSVVARLLSASATMDYADHLDTRQSTLLGSVTEAALKVGNLLGIGLTALGDAALIIVIAVTLLVVSPGAGGTMLVFSVVSSFLWSKFARRRLREAGQISATLVDDRFHSINQGFLMARELRLAGRSEIYANHAMEQTQQLAAAQRSVDFIIPSNRYVLEAIVVLGIALTAAVSAATSNQSAVLPSVAFVLAATFRALPSTYRLMQFSNVADYSRPFLDMVADLPSAMGTTGQLPADNTSRRLRTTPLIELRGVAVRFPRASSNAVERVDLRLAPGSRTGIRGPSGSGKSTLLEVIVGLRPPSAGEALVDGKPMATVSHPYQRVVGFAAQHVPVMNASLAENMAPGIPRTGIDDDAALRALAAVGLADWARALPAGLDAVLGPSGPRLSGGEQLRLGLARALYTDPLVLVLDEVTAHLDPETTTEVIALLDSLDPDITQVAVSHDAAALDYCDAMYELNGGTLHPAGPTATERVL